jgi:hypothetical protein
MEQDLLLAPDSKKWTDFAKFKKWTIFSIDI